MDRDFSDRLSRLRDQKPLTGASVYLHFPCFDGVISAVLAAEFLEHVLGWSIARYVPVNYDRLRTWRFEEVAPESAVVDFLYHPSPLLWADHHVTSFVEPTDRTALDHSGDRILLYDDRSPSCAILLWNHFREYLGNPSRLEQMALWADKIDSARYDSVDEAIFGSGPATDISLSLALRSDQHYCDLLVSRLRMDTLDHVAALPEVRAAAEEVRRRIGVGMNEAAKTASLRFGDIAVLEARQGPDAIISRYSPYHFFPYARYSVSLVQSDDSAKITAMRNPWLDFESIGLGDIFQRFGGGGHQRVASTILPPQLRGSERQVLEQIATEIHRADTDATADRWSTSRG